MLIITDVAQCSFSIHSSINDTKALSGRGGRWCGGGWIVVSSTQVSIAVSLRLPVVSLAHRDKVQG